MAGAIGQRVSLPEGRTGRVTGVTGDQAVVLVAYQGGAVEVAELYEQDDVIPIE